MDCRGAGLEARRGPPRSRSADCTSHCMITDRPRRLAGVSYIGYQRYSLTLCTDFRRPTFQSEDVVNSVLEQLRQTCSLCTFALTAYCFMHDHLHVLATGQSESADLCDFVKRFKQSTAFAYRKDHKESLWQPGYHGSRCAVPPRESNSRRPGERDRRVPICRI